MGESARLKQRREGRRLEVGVDVPRSARRKMACDDRVTSRVGAGAAPATATRRRGETPQLVAVAGDV